VRRRWFAAALVTALMLIAAPGVLAAAQTRISLNGGRPSEWPILSSVLAGQGLTQEAWLEFAKHVGENWLPGTTPVPVDYAGQLGIVSGPNALTTDQSTAVGQVLLHQMILDNLKEGPVAVAGLSEGTLVIDKELAYLATLSKEDAPSRDALTFYVFGDMLRGLGQMYLNGVTIPFIGQTFGPVPETQYDTVVVNEQWDGWANPPDRPWNLLAVLNAVMGAVYTVNGSNDHSQTSLDSLADAVMVSEVKNTLGGTTTTYMIPRQQLPVTKPLLQLGVPSWIVDEIDKVLMSFIQAGYSSLTPNLGPHIERGQLVWTSPPPPAVDPTTTAAQSDVAPVAVETGTASASASSDAAASLKSLATTSAHEAAAVDDGSSLDRQAGPQPAVVSEAADAGAALEDDPEPVATHLPESAPVGAPADSDGSASADKAEGQPADASDAGGSRKDDPASETEHRARPTRVRGSADSDSTADVHGQAKPDGGSEAGTAGADASPHAESAA
jgi:PE-PPE domain